MSSTAQTNNQRREAARARAREQREAQQRQERRRRVLLQASVGVVIVALVAVVAVVIVNAVRPAGPGPTDMANGGITISGSDFAPVTTTAASAGSTPTPEPTPAAGKVLVQVFEDFGCPYCNQFEQANTAQLETLVRSGAADVQYFPVAILDRSFTDRYSTRAANAAAAVANFSPKAWFDFHSRLYAAQPKEGGAGLSDDRLIAIAKQAGATRMPDITKAIRDGRFTDWVGARTDEFSAGKGALAGAAIPSTSLGGTPTVLVNGRYYTGAPGDASAFGAFLAKAAG